MAKRDKKKKSSHRLAIEFVVIIAVALGLALGIQAFLVKPFRIPSPSMVPTLEVGQRVLVNRLGSALRRSRAAATSSSSSRRRAPTRSSCGMPTEPTRRPAVRQADARAVGAQLHQARRRRCPGDWLKRQEQPRLHQGKRQEPSAKEPSSPRDAVRELCNLPTADHDSAGPLFYDGRQPWGERRQPRVGSRSQEMDHRTAPSSPTGRQTASARSKRRPAAPAAACSPSTARSSARFVAGADEAGRGCLAGPLVAAAVLFDLEELTLSDRRSLTRLNDSKQHTEAGREELYPLVLRAAAKASIVVRCVRGIDSRGLHKTNLEALRDGARVRRLRGGDLPRRRLPRARLRLRAARRRRRRLHERGDRRRLRARQGHARPLHAPRRRAASRLGLRDATSATRRPSTARRSRRTAISPLHRLVVRVDRVPAARRSAERAPRSAARGLKTRSPRCSSASSRPAGAEDHPDRVEAQVVAARRGGSRGLSAQPLRGHPAQRGRACAGRSRRAGRRARRVAGDARLHLAEDERALVARRPGRARRSGCGSCGRRSRSRGARGAPRRSARRAAVSRVVGRFHAGQARSSRTDMCVTNVTIQLRLRQSRCTQRPPTATDSSRTRARVVTRVTHVSTRSGLALAACSQASPHSPSRGSTAGRSRSRSTSAAGCPRSRSSACPTPPCARRASACARRCSTPARVPAAAPHREPRAREHAQGGPELRPRARGGAARRERPGAARVARADAPSAASCR